MRESYCSRSVDDTEELGEGLGARLFPGAVLTLSGNMGAGKTAFIRGICRGAGCRTRASSPTYALMHLYEGPSPVCHFDLYRVEDGDPWVSMEVEEIMDDSHIVLIEWPGPVEDILPGEALRITMEPGEDDEQRVITLEGTDPVWMDRLEGLIP